MIWVYIVGGAVAVAVFVAACFTKKPIRSLLTSAMQGICAMAAVNVLSVFSGVTVGLTVFTTYMATVLGLPGVITLLCLQAMLV